MINILPEEQKKIIRHEYWGRFLSLMAIMVAFLGLIAIILILPSYFFSRSKESFVENRLEAFNRENPDIKIEDNIDTIGQDINAKAKILDEKWKGNTYFNETLKILLNVIPPRIKVSQLLYSERTDNVAVFEVHGQASNREVLKDFKTALENNPHFGDVNLPVSNFVQKSNIDFTISFSLNPLN